MDIISQILLCGKLGFLLAEQFFLWITVNYEFKDIHSCCLDK